MGDLDGLLSSELKSEATTSGHELVLPYTAALQAIAIASEHLIAVFGVESFQVLGNDQFRVIDYSGYEIPHVSKWSEFVRENNTQAECWIRERPLGNGYGYILTSTSEREFPRGSIPN